VHEEDRNIKDLARRNLRANFAADIIQFIHHLKFMNRNRCEHSHLYEKNKKVKNEVETK